MIAQMKQALRDVASESDAVFLQRFFKTGKGEYGHGDRFLGVRVPATRKLVRQFSHVTIDDTVELLQSAWHEERLLALLLMVRQYAKGNADARGRLYAAYLRHTRYINNWDLVDSSAEYIVGAHLRADGNAEQVLNRLVASKSVWQRRIAMLSTFHFIKHDEFEHALRVAEQLLSDSHDLIHKAVGWMLREMGNRDLATEKRFLSQHYRVMPRTMLRYAIEKFPEAQRQRYLKGTAT